MCAGGGIRVRWVDNAKGIAMICVILGHVGGGTYGRVDLSFVHAIHLSVFFLLSGYTLKTQNITREYTNKKFKRLMEPYFYTCGAIILMDVFNSIFIVKDEKIFTITYIVGKDIIRSFFASGLVTNFAGIEIGTRIGAIWFLPAMFFAILIVQWVLNQNIKEWKRCAIILFVALLGYISAGYIWLPFSIQAGMTASAFVLTGYYVRKYSILEKFNWAHYLAFLLIFIWGVYKEYDHFYIVANLYPDILITFCVSLSGSFLMIRLARCMQKSRILNFIGRQSVFFLCAHLFALETMGWYFNYIINAIGITGEIPYMWASFILNLLFTTLSTLIISFMTNLKKNTFTLEMYAIKSGKRDCSVDIMKGILIFSMLIGHSAIDINLRRIIFSCHMVAFVFLSGYFYRPVKSLGNRIIQLCKSFLGSYGCFCFVHLTLYWRDGNIDSFLQYLKSYILSISYARVLYTDIMSIGPVYFITMLFCVRLIYLFIDYFVNSDKLKLLFVIMLSIVGVELGNYGYWLPWSLDCALYCLIFYQIGILFKKYNFLEYVSRHSMFYFILSIVWAHMIYSSSMEIAIRQYAPYGLVIVGATSGILLLYMSSKYIATNMLRAISDMLEKVGENTLFILVVHTIFNVYINAWLAKYFNPENIGHMAISIILQICLGTMVGACIKRKWQVKELTLKKISVIKKKIRNLF